MTFTKTGKEVIDTVSTRIKEEQATLKAVMDRFEREKEKSALQRIQEVELNIKRLERVVRHTLGESNYELTEKDLDDFGFD